jgi:small subunit ribosomal protein S14
MAKKSLMNKCAAEPKFKVRKYNRCKICGRARAYIGKFQICRLCFREMAVAGKIPGVTKASW